MFKKHEEKSRLQRAEDDVRIFKDKCQILKEDLVAL